MFFFRKSVSLFGLLILAGLLMVSLACGGGSAGDPNQLLGTGTITGSVDALSGLSKSESMRRKTQQSYELWTLDGVLLMTYTSNSSQFTFKTVPIGKSYIIRARFVEGGALEAITKPIQVGHQNQNVSIDTSVQLQLLRLGGKVTLQNTNLSNDIDALSVASLKNHVIYSQVKNAVMLRYQNDQSIDLALSDVSATDWSAFLGQFQAISSQIETGLPLDQIKTTQQYAFYGRVLDVSGDPLIGVQVMIDGKNMGETGSDGTFIAEGLVEGVHGVSFSKKGYSQGFQRVALGSQTLPTDGKTIILPDSGNQTPKGDSLAKGQIAIQLKASQNLSLSANQPIVLGKPNSPMTMRFSAKGGKAYATIRSKGGEPIFRQKYAGATLNFSTVDPSSEIDAMPGALVTRGLNANQKPRMAGENGDSGEDALVSVSMVDLSLRSADDQKVDLENGDYLETYIKLPDADQEKYRAMYVDGERVVPFYSFSETEGRWVLENESELVLIGDDMYGRVKVTHFSWWNMDYPNRRGRLKGVVYGDVEKTKVLSGVKINIESVATNHSTTAYTNDRGEYDLYVLRNTKLRVRAELGGQVTSWVTINIDNSPENQPHVQDLVLEVKKINGIVKSELGQPLSRALIRLPDGSGVYTGAQGEYEIEVSSNDPFDLLAQYSVGETSFVTKEAFVPSDLSGVNPKRDITVNTKDVITISGVVTENDIPVENAIIYMTSGGEKVKSDSNGRYELIVSKSVNEKSEDTIFVPLRAFFYKPSDRSYPSQDLNLSILSSANSYIQNIYFRTDEKVTVRGKVTLDGAAVAGTEVISNSGQVSTTNAKGEFSFKSYPGQKIKVKAKVTDEAGETLRKSKDVTVFGFKKEDSGSAVEGLADNHLENLDFSSTAGTIYGVVTVLKASGEAVPLPGVKVVSSKSKKEAYTAADGSYELKVKSGKSVPLWFRYHQNELKEKEHLKDVEARGRYEVNVQFDANDIENVAPSIDLVELSAWRVEKGGNVLITVLASDVEDKKGEGMEATLSAIGLSQGNITKMAVNERDNKGLKQSFQFAPYANTLGWVNLNLEVRDSALNVTSKRLNIEVVDKLINKVPTVLGLEAPKNSSKNGEFIVKLAAWDENGDDLSYDFKISPDDGVSLVDAVRGKRGVLKNARKLKFSNAVIGQVYTLTASCSDGQETVSESTLITIINEPPQISQFDPPITMLTWGRKPAQFFVRAIDPDGGSLTYQWELASTGNVLRSPEASEYKSIGATDRVLLNTRTYLAKSSEIQYLNLRVTVSDGEASVFKQVRLNVMPQGVQLIKSPDHLRVEARKKKEDEAQAYLSKMRYGDQAFYEVYLVYNTGDEELVTKNVSVVGSGNRSILLDSETGILTAKNEGRHEIDFHYDSNGLSLSVSLIVDVLPLSLIDVIALAEKWLMVAGQTLQMKVEAIFEDQSHVDVTYSDNTHYLSESPEIAEVSGSGLITARNDGKVNIQYSHYDEDSSVAASGQQEVEVLPVSISEIIVEPNLVEVEIGDEPVEFEVLGRYNDGSERSLGSAGLTYFSHDPKVVVINEDRQAFGVGEGVSKIEFRYKENGREVSAQIDLQVSKPVPKVVRLEVFPSELELSPLEEQVYEVTAVYNTGVRESIDSLSLAVIGSAIEMDGLNLKAISSGNAKVEFQFGDATAVAEVNVVPEPSEAILEEMAQIGGAVYSSELVEKDFGDAAADILVYNKGRTLASVDVSDPENKVDLDAISMGEWISDFHLTDRMIHVTHWYGEYSMVTFDNPAQLEKPLGYGARIEGYAVGVKTAKIGDSRYAFVLSNKKWSRNGRYGIGGVVVLDITNPVNVVRVAKIKLEGWMNDLAIHENHLFVTGRDGYSYNRTTRRWTRTGYNGVRVIDINDPLDGKIVNKIPLSGYTRGVDIDDDDLYVGARGSSWGKANVYQYSLEDITSPRLKTSTSVPTYWVNSFHASGNGVYVSMGSRGVGFLKRDAEGLLTYDSSFKPEPASWVTADEEEGEVDMSGGYWSYVYDVKVHRGVAYIANGHNGMTIYKLKGDQLDTRLQGYPNVSYITDVLRIEDFSIISSGHGGVMSIDNSDISKPKVLDIFSSDQYAVYRLAYDKGTRTLFASAYNRRYYWWWSYYRGKDNIETPYVMFAIRLKKDGTLEEVSRQSMPGSVQDLSFSDGYLYASSIDYRFRTSSQYYKGYVSKLAWDNSVLSPMIDWEVPLDGMADQKNSWSTRYNSRAYGLEKVGDHIYVATPKGLYVLYDSGLDLKHVGAVPAGELTNSSWRYWFYASRIKSFGGGKFLALPTWSGVQVLHLQNKEAPLWINRVSDTWLSDISFSGGMALIAGWKELHLMDMRDVYNPKVSLSANVDGWVQAIDWQDDVATLASGWEGIKFFQVRVDDQQANAAPRLWGDHFDTDVNVSLSANLFYYDGDHDEVTFRVTQDPKLGSVRVGNGDLEYSPQQDVLGYDVFMIEATDGDLSSNAMFSVNILGVNRAPEVSLFMDDIIAESYNGLIIPIVMSDLDGDQLIADVVLTDEFGVLIHRQEVLQSGNVLIGGNTIVAGNYFLNVEVSDGQLSTNIMKSFKINARPVVSFDSPSVVVEPGGNVSVVALVSDPENDKISVSWKYEEGPQLNISSGEPALNFNITASENVVGRAIYQMTADDGYNQTMARLEIIVNSSPTVELLPASSFVVAPGDQITISANVFDQESDLISYDWRVPSTNLVLSSNVDLAEVNLIASGNLGLNHIELMVSDAYHSKVVGANILINARPTLSAGANMVLAANETGVFGAVAADDDGDVLNFGWTLLSGNGVALSDNTVLNPTFLTGATDGVSVYELSVSDGYYKVVDTLTITVNSVPQLGVLANMTVGANTQASLIADVLYHDWSGLNHSWGQVSGATNLNLSVSDNVLAFVAPDVVDTIGLVYTLTYGNNLTLSTNVSIQVNSTPTPFLDDDFFVVNVGSVGVLQGNVIDIEGDSLSYSWTTSAGGNLQLSDTTSMRPTFVGETSAAGEISALMTVSDGYSSANVVQTFWINSSPVAVAGNDMMVSFGETVQLSSVGSHDPDGDTLSYAWTQLSGNSVSLSGSTNAPTFTAPSGNATLLFRLTVSDGYMDAIDEVVVIVGQGQKSFPKMIDGGASHGLMLMESGALYATGAGAYGQLGLGSTNLQTNFTQVFAVGMNSISAGSQHSLGVKDDGSLWAWGYNAYGQLGDNTQIQKLAPSMIMTGNVISVSAGQHHSLVLKDDHSVWAFGRNGFGQLGDGSVSDRYLPTMVMSGNVSDVSAGHHHSLFLKDDGSLWGAGFNAYGQLGSGNTENHQAPVMIFSSNVRKAVAGGSHSLAIKTDGSLWAMGSFSGGDPAYGTSSDNLNPVVMMSSNVVDVAVGTSHSLILKDDGSVWGLGWNAYGQVMDNTTIDRAFVTQVYSSGMSLIGAGDRFSYALSSANVLSVVGENINGQLGSGNTTSSVNILSVPLP